MKIVNAEGDLTDLHSAAAAVQDALDMLVEHLEVLLPAPDAKPAPKLRGKRQTITFGMPPDLIAEIDAIAAAEESLAGEDDRDRDAPVCAELQPEGGSMMARAELLAIGLSLAFSVGAAAQTPSPVPTPADRLALRGAIACTWTLSDSPQQYEVFEALRHFLITVGTLRGTSDPGSDSARAAMKADLDAAGERMKGLKLTGFEDSMVGSCMQREMERMVSLIPLAK